MHRRLLLVSVVIAAMTALAACGGGGSSGQSAAGGSSGKAPASSEPTGTFRFGAAGPPRSWDPHPETRAFAVGPFSLVYEGLLTTDASGDLQPGLATEWTVSADQIELTLREGVEFQDGTPFDAEAVRFNIDKGKQAPGVTGSVLSAIAEVEATDANHVVLKLAKPAPGLLEQLALIPGFMVSPGVSQEDLERGVPAGTGPYQIDVDASSAETKWVLTANEGWWNEDRPRFATIEMQLLRDPEARLNALLAGQIDAASINPNQAAQVEGAGMEVVDAPTNIAVFQVLDADGTRVDALADPKVRQALAHAIDKEAFVKAVMGGAGDPVDQLFPKGAPGYVDGFEGYEFDPERAKELLAEAGVSRLEFAVPAEQIFGVGATALQGMFADIGVDMKVTTVADGAEMTSKIAGAEFPATYTYIPDREPQAAYSKHLLPGAVYNGFKVADPAVEEAEAAALGAFPDQDGMAAAFEDMYRAVYESAWIVPIAQQRNMLAFNPANVSLEAWTGVPLFPFTGSLSPTGA